MSLTKRKQNLNKRKKQVIITNSYLKMYVLTDSVRDHLEEKQVKEDLIYSMRVGGGSIIPFRIFHQIKDVLNKNMLQMKKLKQWF